MSGDRQDMGSGYGDQPAMKERIVPAQQLSDAGEDLVRLAAAKDAEIAYLRNTIGWEASVAYRAEIAALTADRDRWMADNKRLGQALINMNPALSQIAALTEQWDRAMAERNETRDRTYETIRQLREQRDRAMKVVEAARDVHEWLKRNGMMHSAHVSYLGDTLAAFDAEAAAETAPSLPETPE